ncbi:hypothetical protein ONZ45_g1622 [Pleurotus djamor]|nr:hypothetical protein ONZ45_g1622 [Pleurotus djamor]
MSSPQSTEAEATQPTAPLAVIDDVTIGANEQAVVPAAPGDDAVALPLPVPQAPPVATLAGGTVAKLDGNEDPPPPQPSQPDDKTTGSFLNVIINSLRQFFNPGGGQIFVLQFPGRFLELKEYAWDAEGAGIYSQFIKPVAVNEAEFRIADQMYDIAEVIAGPKGIYLSQVYEELLNNLLPKFQDNNLAKHQGEIRKWLLKEVKTPAWLRTIANKPSTSSSSKVDSLAEDEYDFLPDAPFSIAAKADGETMNRIEVSNILMMDYLEAKQKWELERDAMIEEAMGIDPSTPESQRKLNNLTRKLAHITTVRQAQLSAKYSDAVIRGFSHNVREYMGYMDMKTAAEFLQEAKDSLREAAMSSLDGSMKVYPMQMTPVNWWQGLSTNFTLEDLTQNPDLIKAQIDAKSQQLDVLNKQLVALTMGTKGDVDKLRGQVEAAETRLTETRATLAKSYSSNIFSIAQMAIDKRNILNTKQLASLVQPYGIVGDALTNIQSGMEKLAAAQADVNDATRAWTDAASRLALAEATDTRQQQEQIKLTSESLKKDIAELTSRYQALNKGGDTLPQPPPEGTEPKIEDVPILPGGPDSTSGGSRWQEITLHHQVDSEYTYQSDRSSASTSSSQCNLWLWSNSQSSERSEGHGQTETVKTSNEVWVGLRATLVTIDRGGWFRPQFFQESKMYYHINPELKWTKWPDGVKNMDDLKLKGAANLNDLNKYLLPGFAVGFIICKDITIKIKYSSANTRVEKSNMQESSQSSGGVLCWSYSNGSSSNQSENSHSFQACEDGCVIRIPGPQILGYIIQLTHNDTTEPMPDKLPDNFFIPDASYEEVQQGEEEQKTFALAEEPKATLLYDQLDEIMKKANVPQSAMDSVHKAITKELGIVSSDVVH